MESWGFTVFVHASFESKTLACNYISRNSPPAFPSPLVYLFSTSSLLVAAGVLLGWQPRTTQPHPQAPPPLRAGEGLITFAIKTVAGSYMMLHNHSAVSAPFHMIAVMTDDGFTCKKFALPWWSTADLEPPCKFSLMRQYLMQQESLRKSVLNIHQWLAVQVIVNQTFVRNFYTAEFWQPFQRCRSPVNNKRIAILCFTYLHPGHGHGTCTFQTASKSGLETALVCVNRA